MSELPKRIKDLRLSAGMTQEEFGKKFGIVKSTVSLYENGKSTPNDEIKKQICNHFGVSLDYLLGLESSDKLLTAKKTESSRIAYCIGKTGYGYNEIADKFGVSEDLLFDYIDGVLLMPYHLLRSLADLCDVSTDYILGIVENSREKNMDGRRPFDYNYKIAERIENLRSNTDTDSFLCSILSLSEDEFHRMTEYGFIQHIETVISLAEYFNVSCDYLLCRSNYRYVISSDSPSEKLLNSFQQLNYDNKDIIIGDIKKYIKEQKQTASVAADEPEKKASGK